MAGPDHVLVPTVGKPREAEALAYAGETFPDAAVTLLPVVTPLDAPLSEGGVLEREDERTAQADDRARDLVASADADPDRVTIETVEGRPGNAIPRYAAETDVDHVVMRGSDASRSLARRLLGRGIATTVVDRAPVPVTVLD